MDLQEYREQSRKAWTTVAPNWLRERRFMWEASHAVGERLVEGLAPEPGQTILELAAGVGDTGFAAAAEVGDDGRLISTDFSPEMVKGAREHGAELGLGNVEFRVMDAEGMDLESDSVDGVLCRWGYMLMADPSAAFAETRRVLRDGGRLSFAVWAGPERNPWAAVPGATLVERGHVPMPEPGDPGIFSMGDPERIRSLVTAAGFREPEIEEVEIAFSFEDGDEYWRFITSMAAGLAVTIAKQDGEEKATLKNLFEERVSAFETNGGYTIPGVSLTVLTS